MITNVASDDQTLFIDYEGGDVNQQIMVNYGLDEAINNAVNQMLLAKALVDAIETGVSILNNESTLPNAV